MRIFENKDCMVGMAEYPDNYFDLAIVDPPYGIDFISKGQIGNSKFKPKKWDISIPNDSYFIELKRVSKNQIIWGCNYYKNVWPSNSFIYWNKLNHDAKGDGELAITSFNIGNRYFAYMWDGNRYGFPDKKISGVGKPSIRIHPTQKPTALYKWLLQNYAKPGDLILDTHVGSASSLIACIELGFDYVGYELDPDYYKAATERIKRFEAQGDLFRKPAGKDGGQVVQATLFAE